MFAVVTGATGGLGRSIVNECAKRGYDILLSATKQERLEALKEEIEKQYPTIQVFAKECKLNVKESREELFSYISCLDKKPNMLILNAGYILEGSVMGCEQDEIQSCIDVNVTGNMDLVYWFLKNRNVSDQNYLLFVSSMAGFYPMPQMATYASTKAFLSHMAVALRKELKGQKVNVSVVCPGGMATNEAMKRSIKSQGIGGALSAQSTEKIARIGIKNVLKNKAIWVPGFFNQATVFFSKFFPKTTIASAVGNRWVKCEKKRGDYR